MRICFVAAPLIARSGVYNSTVELVREARSRGLPWRAVLGVSPKAGGTASQEDGIHEFEMSPGGPTGVLALSRHLADSEAAVDADLLISMIPQSDMALAFGRKPWVAYLRGLPWPALGETGSAKRAVWRSLESAALRRARQVWATTETLAQEAGPVVDRLVAPGLVPPAVLADASAGGDLIVWAARYSLDKNPLLFLEALRESGLRGVMYGGGPLEQELRDAAPENVEIAGWRDRDAVWHDARVYVGTSTREAFGRSAVEAAMLGIPPLIAQTFGCAPMLYTDAAIAREMVLPIGDASKWRSTCQRLVADDDFHASVVEHVTANAKKLTITAAVARVEEAAAEALNGA